MSGLIFLRSITTGVKNQDLREAVLRDVSDEIQPRLNEVGKKVSAKRLQSRFEVFIDMMCDYLFSHPEVSNLILSGYFSKTRHGVTMDIKIPEYLSSIAVAIKINN
jgi:TetR/AcrR family transcriptional regulator, regulator of cefoperazone and chloramphenicol sensitivity